jgi:hypothetical protein
MAVDAMADKLSMFASTCFVLCRKLKGWRRPIVFVGRENPPLSESSSMHASWSWVSHTSIKCLQGMKETLQI